MSDHPSDVKPAAVLQPSTAAHPPIGVLACALAPLDEWIGSVTTIGATFIAVAATKKAAQSE
jgi:hypothetical protein